MMDKKMCAVVKPLVWHRVDTFGGDCLDAIGATQQYRVLHRDGVWHANCGRSEGYGSQAEAQEAAQSVEAARILSALTIRPEAEARAEAWAAAIEAAAGQLDEMEKSIWEYDIDDAAHAIRALTPPADISAALDRIKVMAKAEGMREAAAIAKSRAGSPGYEPPSPYDRGYTAAVAEVERAILAAIPEVRK